MGKVFFNGFQKRQQGQDRHGIGDEKRKERSYADDVGQQGFEVPSTFFQAPHHKNIGESGLGKKQVDDVATGKGENQGQPCN